MPFDRGGVVAFAFGTPSTILPNQRIAEKALKIAQEHNALVYTQADIELPENLVNVTYTEETAGDPPPTLRIARGAAAWAAKHNLNTLYVVCASPHEWRCKRDLSTAVKERGLDVQVILPFLGETDRESLSWFSPDSTQPRTTSLEAWRKRERILEWMPLWLYKRVAS